MSDETNAPAPGQLSGTQTRKTLLQRPVSMSDTKTRTGIKLRLAKPGAPQVPLSGAAPKPAVPVSPKPPVPGGAVSTQVPPVVKPVVPVVKPAIPAAKPVVPGAKPVVPGVKPVIPISKPVTPVIKPTPLDEGDTSTKSTPTIGASANVLKDTKTRRAILMSKAAPTVRPNTVPIDAKSTATASVPKPLVAPVHNDDRTVKLTRPVRPKPVVTAAPKPIATPGLKPAEPIAAKPVEPETPPVVKPAVAPAPASESPKAAEPTPAPAEKIEQPTPEPKTEAPKFKLKLKLGQKKDSPNSAPPASAPVPSPVPAQAAAPKIVPTGAPKTEPKEKPAPTISEERSKFQIITVSVAMVALLVTTFFTTASFLHVQLDKDITKDIPFLSFLK
ncbi:MAG: hypothetical protein MJ025_02565 [Victivallaceae bacterium]|nr:hypothetical protein [Victivallaceae bacterium]